MSLINVIKLDIKVNHHSKKATTIVVLYRLANYVALHPSFFIRVLGFPLRKIYQILIVWLWGVEIPGITKIGIGFNMGHGGSVVVNSDTIIGDYVLLRQYTTIGNKGIGLNGSPVIGNYVEIGANCVLIGEIIIGDNVIIGAGTVVTKSIPSNCIAYGNPLQIINKNRLILSDEFAV